MKKCVEIIGWSVITIASVAAVAHAIATAVSHSTHASIAHATHSSIAHASDLRSSDIRVGVEGAGVVGDHVGGAIAQLGARQEGVCVVW